MCNTAEIARWAWFLIGGIVLAVFLFGASIGQRLGYWAGRNAERDLGSIRGS